MDAQTAALIAISVFVLLVIFLSLRYRDRIKGGIKGPLGTEVNFEASNPQSTATPGVRMDGVKSHAGSVQAVDRTGRGADVRNAEAYGDVNATSDPHPKAEPPA